MKKIKTGGRKAGTPNKLTKDFKTFLRDFYSEQDDKQTRFEKLQYGLYELATKEKNKAIRLKAIQTILKILGVFDNNNKVEVGIAKDKINIRIGFKEKADE